MPVFEYTCQDCSTRFDVFHKGAEDPERIQCPSCASRSAVKQFSSFSASVGSGASGSACESGACDIPAASSPCAGGMCGLQ
ncbi:zinc ribbon domain-containing protein [bacterium]|nr:zinc ribbon domain-containing protein [bacterium]